MVDLIRADTGAVVVVVVLLLLCSSTAVCDQ